MWYETAVGGHWDEVGDLQMRFLLDHGLEPQMRLLDVACGSLRLGRHAIRYLDRGRYTGVDADRSLIAAGRSVIGGLRVRKAPRLLQLEMPASLPEADVVWIHALFDHISPNATQATIAEALRAAPTVFATFFVVDDSRSEKYWPRRGSDDGIVTYPNREYWHHDRVFIEASGPLHALHGYDHPLGLTVGEFRRS